MKKGDHLFLVDGSGYIFRAYHALPPLNRKSDGLPTSAVLGFCNMVWKLMQDARNTDVGVAPTHFAVIFDYSSKTFRNELYAEYKANRSAPPDDLIPQFGLIREATRAFNLPCIEMEGFEADDMIATYARLACEAGGDTTIISSDKDLMQLVGPTVSMYDPMKDRQIGIPEVIEKWGVPPEKMIDLQAMTGDSVDNVPGVPGIGPKTAAQLLEQFGDLDTLLARAGEIKQEKRRQTIIDNADKARISRELVQAEERRAVDRGAGRSRAAAARRAEADRLPEDDGVHDADAPRRRGDRHRCRRDRAGRRWWSTRADVHGPDVGAGAATPAEIACRRRLSCAGQRRSSPMARSIRPQAPRRRARRRPPRAPRSTTSAMPASAIAPTLADMDRRGARNRHRRLPHRDDLARSDAGRARRLRAGRQPGQAAYMPVGHRTSAGRPAGRRAASTDQMSGR